MKLRLPLLILVALFAGIALGEAATMYGPIPYRQWSDSPFYQGIQEGNIHFENFEDGQLSTPNVSVRNGKPDIDQGVDEDDGILDGMGRNGVWLAPGGGLPEYGSGWSIEITFTPSPVQGYPTFAGLALLGHSVFPPEISEGFRFRAYDGLGADVTGDVFVEAVHLPPGTPYYTSLGDKFIGIHSASGVSKILLSSGRFDHLQYGWAIPEPGVVALTAFAGALLLRRRRPSRSL